MVRRHDRDETFAPETARQVAYELMQQLHRLLTRWLSGKNAFNIPICGLKALGFAVLDVRDVWQFTHIHALKTEYQPREGVHLTF